jgi:hypothetical protein
LPKFSTLKELISYRVRRTSPQKGRVVANIDGLRRKKSGVYKVDTLKREKFLQALAPGGYSSPKKKSGVQYEQEKGSAID